MLMYRIYYLLRKFKSDYLGQPAHGTAGRAGVILNNVAALSVGDDNLNNNLFFKMNAGVEVYNSFGIRLTNNLYTDMIADAAYGTPRLAAAIMVIGSDIPTSAEVYPCTTCTVTIDKANCGIYNTQSSLTVDGVRIINVGIGVNSERVGRNNEVHVTNSTIEASRTGILWRDNGGSIVMEAARNHITTGTNGTGIMMTEPTTASRANYHVHHHNNSNGGIFMNSSQTGISGMNLFNPVIEYNDVTMLTSAPVNSSRMTGILLNGCESSDVNCNYVERNTQVTVSNTGYSINLSTASVIQFNTAEGNDVGMFFGGDCGITNDLAGNTMNNCAVGLYLNSAARIGEQIHRGNRWLPAGGNTVAMNQNIINSNYLNSLIWFNPNDGTNYYPTTINPPQWFQPDFTGNAFSDCGMQVCNAALAGGGSDMEEHLNNIAQQNLYKQLYEDSLLRVSDSVFTNFFSNKQTAAIGKLYEVNSLYSLGTVYDSTYKTQHANLDSLISLKTDSLRMLDSIMFADSTLNYFSLRGTMIDFINDLLDSFKIFTQQKQAEAEPMMDSARYVNTTIMPVELPETNSRAMNEYHYLLYAFGKDTLLHYYNDMLNTAHQCPYAGGPAVYRACAYVYLFNDSIQYDDAAVCLQSGIYRQLIQQDVSSASSFDFRLIPNPAKQNVTVELNFRNENNITLEIRNVMGGKVKELELDKGINTVTFSVERFDDGIYFIRARNNGITLNTPKLIIIK